MPKQIFPELFSFAKNKSMTIHAAKQMESLMDHFHLPLSGQAFDQLLLLLEELENSANSDELDIWGYIWGSPMFTSSKAYKHLCGTRIVHPCFSWLWKSNVQNKHNVFF